MVRGRPFKSYKYRHPIFNDPIGVFEFRFVVSYLKFLNRTKFIKKYNKRGRPCGATGKYKNNKGKPISALEYRYTQQYKEKLKIRYKENYIKIRKSRLTKEALKFGMSLYQYLTFKKKCSFCGFDKFLCDIHHIDFNKNNNHITNLIGLCPNCHMGIHRKYILESSNGKYYYNPKNYDLYKELDFIV